MTINCLKLLNASDNITKRQCLQLLNMLPFLVDLRIKDTVIFMYTDKDLTSDEKNEMEKIIKIT